MVLLSASAASITPPPHRRTANYRPSIWDDDYIQSLPIGFEEESHLRRREELKERVRQLILKQKDAVEQLELVDALLRLGVQYHFELEIECVLNSMSSSITNTSNMSEDINLHCSALLFRLLREHGTDSSNLLVSLNAMIVSFKGRIQHDVKELLSLHEASFLAVEGEDELEEAGEMAAEQLRRLRKNTSLDPKLAEHIDHALELPLHWRMTRLHTRWYIDFYEKQENADSGLLELAKLDFNMVQSAYKMELKEISRWWRNLGLASEELSFARDRLVEAYFWSVGCSYEPHFWRCRKEIAKIGCLLSTIDDIYDVYGSLEELELFTRAVDEWTIVSEQLPRYMKITLTALFNTMNNIASVVFVEKELDILPILRRLCLDLSKAYLLEARWYYSGYTPTLNEYIENGWMTIAGPLLSACAYCLSEDLTMEALNNLRFYPDVVRQSSLIARLYDDLGTSNDEILRGDVAKSIQCHMKHKNVSEKAAREHIRWLIRKHWKTMNEGLIANQQLLGSFKSHVINFPRMAQFIYQYGDGHGKPEVETRVQVISLIVEPIPL